MLRLKDPNTSPGGAMSPLFRKTEEQKARKAAIKAEIARLKMLSDAELAVLVLPALGPDGINPGSSVRLQQMSEYLLRDFPGVGTLDTVELMSAARRGADRLERAGLVRSIAIQRTPQYRITRDGEITLAERTVQERTANPM
jgi:hypothetical protein